MDDQREVLEQRLLNDRWIDPNGCWVWAGPVYPRTGYGRIWIRTLNDRLLVHRVAAHVWLGFDLDSSLCVLHRCDNPPCFNPEHLFIGTKKDNTHDMMRKGRMRHRALRGEDNPRSILREQDVVAIRSLTDPYKGHRRVPNGLYDRLAAHYGVSKGVIVSVAHRRHWRHVP